MAIKIESMTEQEIESTAEAFADYSYENEEKDVLYMFPNRESVKIYMRGFVQASLKCGWMHATSGRREGSYLYDLIKPVAEL